MSSSLVHSNGSPPTYFGKSILASLDWRFVFWLQDVLWCSEPLTPFPLCSNLWSLPLYDSGCISHIIWNPGVWNGALICTNNVLFSSEGSIWLLISERMPCISPFFPILTLLGFVALLSSFEKEWPTSCAQSEISIKTGLIAATTVGRAMSLLWGPTLGISGIDEPAKSCRGQMQGSQCTCYLQARWIWRNQRWKWWMELAKA